MGLFGRKGKNAGNTVPEEWRCIKWGISSPLMLQLSDGICSIRAYGSFSCGVSDAGLLAENGCDAENGVSLRQFSNYLSDMVVRSFKDVLGARSGSMTEDGLLSSSELLSRATGEGVSSRLAEKGVSLVGLQVEKLLKA